MLFAVSSLFQFHLTGVVMDIVDRPFEQEETTATMSISHPMTRYYSPFLFSFNAFWLVLEWTLLIDRLNKKKQQVHWTSFIQWQDTTHHFSSLLILFDWCCNEHCWSAVWTRRNNGHNQDQLFKRNQWYKCYEYLFTIMIKRRRDREFQPKKTSRIFWMPYWSAMATELLIIHHLFSFSTLSWTGMMTFTIYQRASQVVTKTHRKMCRDVVP